MPRISIVVATVLTASVLAACRKPEPSPAPPAADDAVAAADAATRASPSAQPGAAPAPPAAASDAPALSVATLDGKTFDLAAHRGQWVVVNFWATWCAPCLKEMPELSALDAMREHIDVVGLAYEEIDAGAMRDFLKQHPVVYPVAIIDTYNPPQDFDTPRGLPMTYLIAPDGKIAKKILGPVTAKEIEAAIATAGGDKTAIPTAGGDKTAIPATGGGKRKPPAGPDKA